MEIIWKLLRVKLEKSLSMTYWQGFSGGYLGQTKHFKISQVYLGEDVSNNRRNTKEDINNNKIFKLFDCSKGDDGNNNHDIINSEVY